jgi:mersacidin/lichenicidin family type 2 lantibiotic
MDPQTLIRAWKDPDFRASLSPEQRSSLPENPSGKSITELNDSDLENAVGGLYVYTAKFLCCTETFRVCPTTTVLSLRLCPTGPVCLPGPLPL